MKFFRKMGKWALVLYITQAVIGAGVGTYFAIKHPDMIERMVSCVAY